MRDPWEWEEEDLEALVASGVQESLTLDYKRCAALDKQNPKRAADLSKDVSAFANSAGGVIVYGVVEVNNLPTAVDQGYDPSELTREWIEQVINSSIQRRVDGVRIEQVPLNKNSPGQVAYVVAVAQSRRAPHMATDHVFYKRFNAEVLGAQGRWTEGPGPAVAGWSTCARSGACREPSIVNIADSRHRLWQRRRPGGC
jgi:predicted HTH transcriptional regulator